MGYIFTLSKYFQFKTKIAHYVFNCINNGINICISDAFVGCPKVGYYNGSACCPSEKCQRCNLDTGTCLVCQPGYQGVRCEQGNIKYE